jgi:Na+/H+ antiporter NhaD/arsenite permease-like protein
LAWLHHFFVDVVKPFAKKNVVMVIAAAAALVTALIIPPDKAYVDYFDFKTLTCLFCVLAVVCALKNIRFFYILARKIVELFKTARMSVLALVYITFIGSMLIANDMALLTFLPLGFFVLNETGMKKYMAFTFIMQNIAANLGGMLTPFGNPQNLYIYTKYNIPSLEFMGIMLPPFLLAVALLTLCAFLFPKTKMELRGREYFVFKKKRTAVYLALFVISILMVFSVFPYYIGLAVIFVSILILDRYALLRVDYPLLLTFLMFFIFAGNMSRIDVIKDTLSTLLEKNTLVFSALSCQIISNVPSAILLSQFTDNFKALLYGVNIGGTGTIIASLASLITFSEYSRVQPNGKKKYLGIFTLLNIAFFVILLGFCAIIL